VLTLARVQPFGAASTILDTGYSALQLLQGFTDSWLTVDDSWAMLVGSRSGITQDATGRLLIIGPDTFAELNAAANAAGGLLTQFDVASQSGDLATRVAGYEQVNGDDQIKGFVGTVGQVRALLKNFISKLAATGSATASTATATSTSLPLYKKTGFWIALGGVFAAAGVGAIVIGRMKRSR